MMTLLLQLSYCLTLLALCGSTAAVDTSSADYESKIQAALENYAAHSDEILQRAIELGNNDGSAAIDNVEIDANGDIISSSSSTAFYADFGLKAINAQLHKINQLTLQHDLYQEYEEVFEELSADSTTITYEQLKEWEEIAPILVKLYDGEFHNLWQKATGSESSQESEMELSQFIKFNDLLDRLVMAKVDFKALTKRLGKPEIPYDRLSKWPALSEDISEKDFFALWKKALGEDVAKGVMNYEQFLLFYDIAGKWLERDIGDVIEEEEERRENYWVKSGNNKKKDTNDSSSDDDDEEDDDDGYDLQDNSRPRFYIADEDLPDDIREGLESEDEDIRNEAAMRRRLDPEMWQQFSYWEIYAYFGCEKAFSSPRPLWTDEQWWDVREFYHEFTAEDKKDGPTLLRDRSYQFTKEEVDFSKTFIPFQSGEKGRGLQAVRDIQAGELVFRATNNTIVFNYGHTWRKLLFAVYERFGDPGITCDMHVWSWVQDLYEGGPMKVLMDLDSGSLLNEGRDEPDDPEWEPPNVQCGKPDATRCDMDYYAFRDIKEGDELLIDYREFAFLDAWPAMGL